MLDEVVSRGTEAGPMGCAMSTRVANIAGFTARPGSASGDCAQAVGRRALPGRRRLASSEALHEGSESYVT